jgi:PhnB protein
MTMASSMQLQPYLFFEGRCDEALAFYRGALGAEVTMLMRFKESPDPGMVAPGTGDKVMHASFRIGETTVLASDGRCEGRPSFQGFALSLTVPNESEAERLFGALGEGGQVQMPMTKTFFSPRFGMVADRFGVSWMVYVAP